MLNLEDFEDRYQRLREFDWKSPDPEPKPIPAGEKVRVATTGAYWTDKHGITLGFEKSGRFRSQSRMMATMLNHAWEIYVRPTVNEMEKNGEDLPGQISTILVKYDGAKMVTEFNPQGSLGNMRLRPGVTKNAGDEILLSEIIELGPMDLPTHDGNPTKWLLMRFHGHQITIMFDFRPGEEGGPTSWGQEDREWMGYCLGMSMLALTYGHSRIIIPRLRQRDVPFSIGAPMDNMVAVCDAVAGDEVDEAKFDAALESCLDAHAIKAMVTEWTKHEPWKGRSEIWLDALKCYEAGAYGGAVTQLMAQVEGIMMDLIVPEGKGIAKDGKSENWKTRVKHLEKLASKDLGPMRSETAQRPRLHSQQQALLEFQVARQSRRH